MSEIKVSILVPVYNVSQYLRRCLDSCIHQTMQEIEIIVVNDCSPDPLDSEIMREYEARYPHKIRCIWHSQNKKLGGARNTGIRAAKGKYLYFVDSDDCIELTLCQKMYDSIVKNGADMSVCDGDSIENNAVIPYWSSNGDFDSENLIARMKSLKIYTTWLIMIKRSVIVDNDLFFPEGLLIEDMQCILWYLAAKKIVRVKEILYHYIIRSDSIIQNYTLETYQMALQVIVSILKSDFFQGLVNEIKEVTIVYLMKIALNLTKKLNLNYPDSLLDYCKNLLQIEETLEFNMSEIQYHSEGATYIKNIFAFIKQNIENADFCSQYLAYWAYQADLCTLSLCYKNLQNYAGKRITIWGAGKRGERNCRVLTQLGVCAEVTDLNEKLYGKKIDYNTVVKPWVELRDVTDVVFVSVVGHFKEIQTAILQDSSGMEVIDFEDLVGWNI